jgi:KDO2-lipid IV(A) lauroyltransferase
LFRRWFKAGTGPVAWALYVSLRFLLAVVQMLPVDSLVPIGHRLAAIWKRLSPRHRNLAIEHLERAMGDQYSHEDIERIADQSLASVATFAMEVACAPRVLRPATWPRYITPVNFDETLALLVAGRGVILVTGHYGSFEMPGYLLANLGFETHAVMRPIDNEYINRFVVESRRAHGLHLLDKKGAMTDARSILERGCALAFIADQSAGRKGIFVDFFGRPASTYKSIGLLAMATESPIAVGYSRRIGDAFRFEVGVSRLIHPAEWADQDHPLRWITQAFSNAMEDFIRQEPGQYWWLHRRWKSQPKPRRDPPPAGPEEKIDPLFAEPRAGSRRVPGRDLAVTPPARSEKGRGP